MTGHGALAWAQQTVPAGVAALLVGTIPIWMALFDRVAFGRRLAVGAYIGIALGFGGLAFLFDPFGDGVGRPARSARDRRQRDVLGGRLALLAQRSAAETPTRLGRSRIALRRDPARGLLGRVRRDRRGRLDDERGSRARVPHRRGQLRRLHGVRVAACERRRSRSSRRTRTSIRSWRSRSDGSSSERTSRCRCSSPGRRCSSRSP